MRLFDWFMLVSVIFLGVALFFVNLAIRSMTKAFEHILNALEILNKRKLS